MCSSDLSMKGTTLARLVEIAADLKFSARAVRLELSELAQLTLPCILHWELNHFVVLVKVERGGIVVIDPALGRRVYSMAEVDQRFSGVALELATRADFQAKKEKTQLDLTPFFRGQRGLWSAFGQVLLLSFALEIMAILIPLANQWLIDDVTVSGDVDLLFVLALAVLLSACASKPEPLPVVPAVDLPQLVMPLGHRAPQCDRRLEQRLCLVEPVLPGAQDAQ